jgi:hypothetical protein
MARQLNRYTQIRYRCFHTAQATLPALAAEETMSAKELFRIAYAKYSLDTSEVSFNRYMRRAIRPPSNAGLTRVTLPSFTTNSLNQS